MIYKQDPMGCCDRAEGKGSRLHLKSERLCWNNKAFSHLLSNKKQNSPTFLTGVFCWFSTWLCFIYILSSFTSHSHCRAYFGGVEKQACACYL